MSWRCPQSLPRPVGAQLHPKTWPQGMHAMRTPVTQDARPAGGTLAGGVHHHPWAPPCQALHASFSPLHREAEGSPGVAQLQGGSPVPHA